MDRLTPFIGKGIKLSKTISVYSPTIDEITELDEGLYNLYLIFSTFDESILKQLNIKEGTQEHEELMKYDIFELFLKIKDLSNMFIESFLFFTRKNKEEIDIVVDSDNQQIILNDLSLNKGNYKEYVNIIRQLNGIEEEKKPVFRNQKAKEMYEMMQEKRKKYNKNKSLELKDVLSILCAADGNGIDVFNCNKLSVYQIYEHFERLTLKEANYRMVQVWANGHLDKSSSLQEWMTKTTL